MSKPKLLDLLAGIEGIALGIIEWGAIILCLIYGQWGWAGTIAAIANFSLIYHYTNKNHA